MAKGEREFFDVSEIDWRPVEGGSGAQGPGVWEKILSRDEKTGDYTRILRLDPGVETVEVLEHDFWEEVIILDGCLVDQTLNQEFTKGCMDADLRE